MLPTEISDTRLQSMLKKFIATNPVWMNKLKGLYYCGSQVIHELGSLPAVFVVSDENKADFFGLAECHSSWACPRCSAKVMSKKGRRIASALDALSKWYNQSAFMITFTLPHTQHMTCEETFTILKQTWDAFRKNRTAKVHSTKTYTLKLDKDQKNTRGGKAVGKKGEQRIYQVQRKSAITQMTDACQIKHNVKVYEFTWGANSWHPHIHALWWVPNDKWHLIAQYEKPLLDQWFHFARVEALKFWNKKYPDRKEENKKFVDNLYADYKKTYKDNQGKDQYIGVYISKDKNGIPIKQKSSMYLQGWGADKETSGLAYKKAKKGHYTTHQILEEAYNATTKEEREKWLKLYIEYAIATRGKRRIQTSQSGLNEIIDRWEQLNDTVETFKKKATDKAPIKVVCWFSEQQWRDICDLDTKIPIKYQILSLARAPCFAKQLIESLLLENGIDITRNPKHHLEDHINSIFAA